MHNLIVQTRHKASFVIIQNIERHERTRTGVHCTAC